MFKAEPSNSQGVLVVTGLVACLVGACLSVPGFFELFPQDWLSESHLRSAARGSILLVAYGLICWLVAWRLPRLNASRVLSLSVLCSLLVGFEAIGRPFVQSYTTIFKADSALGWRLRPGASDLWLGVDVEINSLGMRGPLPHATADATVLFLGDSVTFGAFLERDAQTIPAMAQAALAARGLGAQCLNGGVGGWSPWQEERWLGEMSDELAPDIVIINLVLNDATESLSLGSPDDEFGFQLGRTVDPGLLSNTTWANALRSWRRKLRGEALRLAASRESELGVYELLRSPELPISRAAWSGHMSALESLVRKVESIGATPVVVAHPYTVQFEVPGLWWPQSRYEEWCQLNGVVFLNVARALEGQDDEPGAYYHDGVHPNKGGAALIGRAIASQLVDHKLLP